MKAPFFMIINGTWYNPGDDVKEKDEKYFIVEAKKRKMQTEEKNKERIKRQTVTTNTKSGCKLAGD